MASARGTCSQTRGAFHRSTQTHVLPPAPPQQFANHDEGQVLYGEWQCSTAGCYETGAQDIRAPAAVLC
jgi:hypothetical protein